MSNRQEPRFPAANGKGVSGIRPYYAPGLSQANYTTLSAPSLPTFPVNSTYLTDDLDDLDLIDSRAAARELINFVALKFLTTAVNSPFEVANTLLQVQYLPTDQDNRLFNAQLQSTEDETNSDYAEEENDDEDDEEEDDEDIYGTGSGSRSRRRHSSDEPYQQPTLDPSDPMFKRHVPVDESGYIVRPSVYDEGTRPQHQLPPIEGGVWKTIKLLLNKEGEGWKSLFKGQYTNWLYEISHLFLQPTLEGTLNDAFGLYDDTIPLVHLDHAGPNVATIVFSHLIIGVLLSPLELVKTRMIVQSASPLQRKYKGPLHALRTIMAEEGGLKGLYMSHNLVPTMLYHSLIPLISNTGPLIIDRVFRVSAVDSPFLYGLAQLGLDTLELIITLPLETIRKRMQCQIRSRVPGKRFESVVPLRPVPYAGVGDAIYKIMKEEGGKPATRKNRKTSSRGIQYAGLGLRGLYQGFGMQCTTNIVFFVFHAINGIEADDFEDF
ncbi:mitochondrial carrier domain-containing protein [Umbelopsis sp. AD052]|nr:mitochondrial carrier domain-containing protein [Umbelopsis sp. AD052]